MQMVSIFGLFVEASEDADGAGQSVAGLLGASSIVGLLIAIPALYWKRTLFLNVYMVGVYRLYSSSRSAVTLLQAVDPPIAWKGAAAWSFVKSFEPTT
jgi:hypothetical protein